MARVLRLFNPFIIPLIRKTSLLSYGPSSLCSYSHLPFFFLSRGEDTRASASCPSNTTSKQAVSSEGESGDSDLGVEIFRSSWRPLLSIVLLGMMVGVGLIHPCCKVYSEFVMTCVVLIVWLLLFCFILRRCGWARPMAAPSGREAIALIRVFGGCCDAGEAGWW